MAEPENVDLREAVTWVVNNYELVVVAKDTGGFDLVWGKALTKPPSNAAKTYMRVAAGAPVKFFSDVVPRFVQENLDEEDSIEDIAREKKSVLEMKKLLRQFRGEKEIAPKPKGKKLGRPRKVTPEAEKEAEDENKPGD